VRGDGHDLHGHLAGREPDANAEPPAPKPRVRELAPPGDDHDALRAPRRRARDETERRLERRWLLDGRRRWRWSCREHVATIERLRSAPVPSTNQEPELVVSEDGTPIAVWRSGEGRPLVLVHGATADHTRWAPVLPALEARFTVLTVDRRGRGRSGDASTYSIEREFEDVVAVVEWAGDGVYLLGHSYGGVCSLEAARLTDRIEKLVVYEPPLGFVGSPPEVVDELDALQAGGDPEELVTFFMREVVGIPPEEIEFLRSLPTWNARVGAADTIPREERSNRVYEFDPDRFRDMRVPTLFLLGGDSPQLFKSAAAAVDAALPDCRLVTMPGQRHAAMDTAPELFTAEVLGFLDDT